MKKETKAVHAGTFLSVEDKGVNSPIFPSTAHRYIDEAALGYPRYLNTGNQSILVNKMAALEHTEDAIIFGSGLAAIGHTLLALIGEFSSEEKPEIWIQEDIYGGTRGFIEQELITKAKIQWFSIGQFPETGSPFLIYFETPTNPVVRIQDIESVVAKAKELGALTMIDNTFATPINQNPAKWGVDLIAHSGTKYLGGHSDLIFGVLCGSTELLKLIKPYAIRYGATVNAQTAWQIERSIKTLAVRMDRHNSNAQWIAEQLEHMDFATQVSYPGLPSHPSHDTARKQMTGFSGMVSFDLTLPNPSEFARELKLITPAISLGGVESLMSFPTKTSHSALDSETLTKMGISEQTIRLSVGIENKADILEDLKEAARKLSTPGL